jgi:predicted transcriptional regulator
LYKDELKELKYTVNEETAQKIIENVLKEIKDPERNRIMKKLYFSKYPCSIYTIFEESVNHLNVLEDIGLISQTTVGNTQKYHLTDFGNKLMNLDKVNNVNKKLNKIQTEKKE